MSVAWFAAALVAGIAAAWLGIPPWRDRQAALERNRNADRYLAWRGRRGPTETPPPMPPRLWVAMGLSAAAVVSVVIGLVVG